MKNIFYIICTFIALAACNSAENNSAKETKTVTTTKNKLADLGWLKGDWYLQSADGRIIESWTETSDTLLSGYSCVISTKGDTMFSETIKLLQSGDTLWYIPLVSNQNNGEEVRFKEKTVSKDEIVFENAAHDFPQRIIYKRTSDSTIYARVEGVQNGKEHFEEFPYKKLNK